MLVRKSINYDSCLEIIVSKLFEKFTLTLKNHAVSTLIPVPVCSTNSWNKRSTFEKSQVGEMWKIQGLSLYSFNKFFNFLATERITLWEFFLPILKYLQTVKLLMNFAPE